MISVLHISASIVDSCSSLQAKRRSVLNVSKCQERRHTLILSVTPSRGGCLFADVHQSVWPMSKDITSTSYQMCLCRFTKTVLDCQNCSENSIIYSCVIFGYNFWHLTSVSSRTFLTTRTVRGCQKVFWKQNNYSAYLLDNVWHLRSMSSWTFPRHTGALYTARWFWCVSNDPILLGCIRGQYLWIPVLLNGLNGQRKTKLSWHFNIILESIIYTNNCLVFVWLPCEQYIKEAAVDCHSMGCHVAHTNIFQAN